MLLPIQEKQIRYNRALRSKPVEYIVIHDTANRSAGADAYNHYLYFNNAERNASADIFVDDSNIIQINDYTKFYTYHCGDVTDNPGPYRNIVSNKNSMGIELCINSDGDYDKAFNNLVELVIYLMNKLSIDVDHIIRHKDVSGKNCPTTMNANNEKLWKLFKEQISRNTEELTMSQYNELLGYIHTLEHNLAGAFKNVDELKSTIKSLSNKLDSLSNHSEIRYGYIDDNMPSWATDTIKKLVDRGALKGDENGNLKLSEDNLRTYVILDRLGVIDDSIKYNYLSDIPDWGCNVVKHLMNNGVIQAKDGELNLSLQTIRLLTYLQRLNMIV